jgi:CheY-like chemotaxis protein
LKTDVLLVEDNDADVLLFERAVARSSRPFTLKTAIDGEEVQRLLAAGGPRPSLILLDLKLPRKSGIEILEWLSTRPDLKDVPIVVLTSSAEAADIRSAYRLGAKAYIVKPVGFDLLKGLVAAVSEFLLDPASGPERMLAPHSVPRPSLM